jgi:hypothetical protein
MQGKIVRGERNFLQIELMDRVGRAVAGFAASQGQQPYDFERMWRELKIDDPH